MNRHVTPDDLFDLFGPSERAVPPGDVLEQVLDAVLRIEHLLALRMVIEYGTLEQQQRARQHLLDELAQQERDSTR